MNMMRWMAQQVQEPVKKTMPVLSFPSVSLLHITVKELISSSRLQAEGMAAIARRVPSLASVSMMDLSVEAEAFGSQVRFTDDEVPAVLGSLVETQSQAQDLPVPQVGAGRTGIYVEALSQAVKLIQDRPVFAGMIGPFSLAGRLLDVTEAMMKCYDEPETVHLVLEKATEFLIRYALAYREVGAHGIVMAEPLTGLLSPDLAEEFSEPYVRRIIQAVQREDFLVIYHNCGGGVLRMLDSILRVGASAYHFGNAIDMEEVMKRVPSHVVAMGNLDPAALFRAGTPDMMRQATQALLEKCGRYPNFLISSGCDIPPLTPWENIDAYFQQVTAFYQAKA